jgi:acetyltransferase-like isoleucine patch superfamily enzyme
VSDYFAHPTSVIDRGAKIGTGSKIWHFTHVRETAVIGADVSIGQNCYIEGVIGEMAKIQNNVSIYDGVEICRGAFVGPSVVFTNDLYPRSHPESGWARVPTFVTDYASIGAGAVIRCGVTIGMHAMVGAGAVVTDNVLSHALVQGNPARQVGWVCRQGHPMAWIGFMFYHCTICGDRMSVEFRYDDDSATRRVPELPRRDGAHAG